MLLESYAESHEQEGGCWVVVYHPAYLTSTVLSTGENSPLGGYVVTVSDETGMALQVKWSLEGKDEKTYTEQTWGQASAYSAKMLPWVTKLMDGCVPLLVTEDGEMAGMPTGYEDKAAFDQIFRDVGFDATRYNHVVPQPGDIPYEKAVDIVARVLLEECDVSRAVFDAIGFAYADLTQETDHREWYFWVQNAEEQCSWTVVFNAETGEILYVVADPFANSNG